MKLILVTLCALGAIVFVDAQAYHRGPPPSHGHGHGPSSHGQGQPQPNSEAAKKAEEVKRRCQSQEQATETDMQEFAQQRKPSTKTGKCLHACLMESIGLIENGMLSAENSVRFMSHMAQGNTELIQIIKEISKECEEMKDDDRCELAFKIMNCTEGGIRKRQDEMQKIMPRRPH